MSTSRRVAKLVEVAGRSTTDDNTALNAIRLARTLAEKEGQAIHEVLRGSQGDSSGLAGVVTDLSYDEFQERMATLEAALHAAQKGYKRLERTMERSVMQITDRHARAQNRLLDKGRNEDGSMPWGAFEKKATNMLGQRHGMSSIFARHMGVPLTEVYRWRKEGVVPTEAVEMLKTFSPAAKGEKEKDSLNWTFEMDDEVMELSEGSTDSQMAEILTERWGKLVTFGGVKKARQRARAKAEALRLFDSGITAVEEINQRLVKEFGPGFGGVTKIRIEQAIKHYRHEMVVSLGETREPA